MPMSPALHIRRLTNPTRTYAAFYRTTTKQWALSAAELDRAATVLAAAWHGDHFAEAVIGGKYEYMIPWRRATIAAAVVGGELHVASYEGNDEEIVGVSAWFGPGKALFDSSEQRATGFDALMESYPAELRKWWMECFLPSYTANVNAALGEGIKLAAWHLQSLATHPKFQRRGIGRALVEFMEAKVFPENEIVLETQTAKNVSTYTKWGYKATPPGHYESATGGFDLYAMIKSTRHRDISYI